MSLAVTATYDARLRIWWSQHRIRVDATLRITNTSAGPIDRVELNTIAARIGNIALDPVTVDGVAVKATRSDQTIVVPLGGILPMGGTTSIRVRYGATLHTNLSGSNWMFTKANGIIDLYRWLPWVSRRTAFARPNHGDPFVTPSSPSVHVRIVTDRKLTFATTGERTGLSSDGLTLDYTATDVRDFTVTAAADYRIASRAVGDNVVRVYYRPGGPGPAMLDGTADAFKAMEALLGPYPYPTLRVVQSSGAYGMESPGMIWIPTGAPSANLRYLTAHETAHQWFYGIVGNDQARQPFADEAAADFVARHVTGLQRSPRCSASPARPPDLRLQLDLLLRADLHPGRQPARVGAQAHRSKRVLGGHAQVHRRSPVRAQLERDAAAGARRRHAEGPRRHALRAAVPLDLLRRQSAGPLRRPRDDRGRLSGRLSSSVEPPGG